MKKNILIFMTDHMRGDNVPPYHTTVMPNLEAFAREAVCFSRAYTVSPHCCPARASFFSGVYPSQHGIWNNIHVDNALGRTLKDGVKLWSEDLHDAGYKMHYTGKWHVDFERDPSDFGFDSEECLFSAGVKSNRSGEAFDTYKNEWRPYVNGFCTKAPHERGEGEIVRIGYPDYRLYFQHDGDHIDKRVTSAAIRKIREYAAEDDGRPWCIYAGVIGPHDSYHAPQRFLDLYDLNDIELPPSYYDKMTDKPAMYRRIRSHFDQLSEREIKEGIRHFRAYCSFEDWLFGQIVDELKETGQWDNTVVLFTGDHGDYAGEHGLFTKGLPCFNSAYHIPFMLGGGGIKAGICGDLVNICDWAPTILDLCGMDVDAAGRGFAGYSLMPYLCGGKPANVRTEHYTQSNGNELYGIQRSVMDGKYKLVYNGFDYDELYDLQNDPEQTRNLIYNGIGDYADIVRDLYQKLWRFAYAHHDGCVNGYIFTSFAPFGPGIIN